MIGNNISSIRPIRANFTPNKITQKAKAQSFGAKIPSAQQATTKGKSFFSSIVKLLKINDFVKSFKSSPIDKLKKDSEKALSGSDTTTINYQSKVRRRKKKQREWLTRGSVLVPSVEIFRPGRNGTYISLHKYEKTELCPPEVRLTRYDSDNDCDCCVLEEIVIRPNNISHMKCSNKDDHYTMDYYSNRAIPEGQQLGKWLNLAKKLFLAPEKHKPS